MTVISDACHLLTTWFLVWLFQVLICVLDKWSSHLVLLTWRRRLDAGVDTLSLYQLNRAPFYRFIHHLSSFVICTAVHTPNIQIKGCCHASPLSTHLFPSSSFFVDCLHVLRALVVVSIKTLRLLCNHVNKSWSSYSFTASLIVILLCDIWLS